jgi:methionyl-tRNA synthetase
MSVAEARQQLQAAVIEERKQKADAALEQIQALSAEGAAIREELEPLKVQIKTARDYRLGRVFAELCQARDQIARLEQPLDPLSFPTAADERKRGRDLAFWREKQQQWLEEDAKCKRGEAVWTRARQLQNRLDYLTSSINNLENVAAGLQPGEVRGGIFKVGEDLIGNGPFVRPQN